ncbi:MAG: hypothetical protein J7647_03490 [Cyanobacteria bacterium SBLK]|nr:hypothetical protein [Cyanobacteria bacterium SBLK]
MPLAAIILVFLSATTHATWNLLAHSQQKVSGNLFLRCLIVAGFAGLVSELVAEWHGDRFSILLWGAILISGIVHAAYYFGLTMGYRHGNFTIVYPVSRALPVLFLAGFDVLRGYEPSLLGWSGIALVMAGCAIAPLQSLQAISFRDYWNWSAVWVLAIVLATVAYTTIDKVAVDVLLPHHMASSARYELLQAFFTVPCLWLMLQFIEEERPHDPNKLQTVYQTSGEQPISLRSSLFSFFANWKSAILFSLFVFGSYWFMLLAYQFSAHVSYLTSLRQISIVLGVIVGTLILREPSPRLRIGAAILITLGCLCIAQS